MKRVRIPVMAREHEFADKTRDEWEQVVYEQADHFTVSRFAGRYHAEKFRTNRHPNILEAVKDAVTGGGEPMVYAVAKTGRNVLIPRDRWVELIREFAERNPDYREIE